ncbi:MAG: sulfatase [Prolixibacteraceae bacterium]|nr:sulfatase [Prolixibacteraceae bacterium]
MCAKRKILNFLILAFIFAGSIFSVLSACKKTSDKPNILWITIEDTSPQFIGFYGNSVVKTPNIDKLAREGVIFTRAFSTSPVCSASRSCIITGVNNGQLGTGNHRRRYPIPDFIKGFPAYLRQAGYYTSNNFKTDYNTSNDSEIIAQAWDESSAKASYNGKSDNQAFFSVFNFEDSHQSRTMTHPWKWYEEFVLQKLDSALVTDADEVKIPPIYRESSDMHKYISRVYNSKNLMDVEVGKLIDSLKNSGLMESTIIFFFADHGEAIPRGKSSSIGLGYHIPFFIWFPEKYKHLSPWQLRKTTDELVSLEDLPPTLLSLAGVEIPDYMTGRPILGKQREPARQYIFGCRNRIDESPDMVRTATDGRYFYTREFFQGYPSLALQKYADVSDIVRLMRKEYAEGKLNSNQSLMFGRKDMEYLYDLETDPWELNNLAGNPEFSSKLEELRIANYNSLVFNRDAHFLPEFELESIAEKSNVFQFVRDSAFHMQEIIDAAYLATNPKTDIEKLYQLLSDKNKWIRYWAITGLYHRNEKSNFKKAEIIRAMNDNYPPVAIEAAAIAWENFELPEAKEILIKYVLSRDFALSLQTLQLIEYLTKVPPDLLNAVQVLSEKTKVGTDGYQFNHNLNCAIDFVLFKFNGNPLFLDNFKVWTDSSQLVHHKILPVGY